MDNENMNTNVNQETGGDENKQTEKTYTQAEVDALIQSESDKRVSQALKTQKEKFDKKQSEAEKLRNMDETQKLAYQVEQLQAELAERDKQAAIADNQRQATSIFAERGLPVQFVDYVVSDDAESMLDAINKFDTQWKAALADAVSQRISGSAGTPKAGSNKQTGLTREAFNKMYLSEQAEIAKTNPILYKELTLR